MVKLWSAATVVTWEKGGRGVEVEWHVMLHAHGTEKNDCLLDTLEFLQP